MHTTYLHTLSFAGCRCTNVPIWRRERQQHVGTRRSVKNSETSEQQKHFFRARKIDVSQNTTFEHLLALDVLFTCASMSKSWCALLLRVMDGKFLSKAELLLTVPVTMCALLLGATDEKFLARAKGVLGDDHVRSSVTVKCYVWFAGAQMYRPNNVKDNNTLARGGVWSIWKLVNNNTTSLKPVKLMSLTSQHLSSLWHWTYCLPVLACRDHDARCY
jgi:hypothetical protein